MKWWLFILLCYFTEVKSTVNLFVNSTIKYNWTEARNVYHNKSQFRLVGKDGLCKDLLKISVPELRYVFPASWINGYILRSPWLLVLGGLKKSLDQQETAIFDIGVNESFACNQYCAKGLQNVINGTLTYPCMCSSLGLNSEDKEQANVSVKSENDHKELFYKTLYKSFPASIREGKTIQEKLGYNCATINGYLSVGSKRCQKKLPFICINNSDPNNSFVPHVNKAWANAYEYCEEKDAQLTSGERLDSLKLDNGIDYWIGYFRVEIIQWEKDIILDKNCSWDKLCLAVAENSTYLQARNCSMKLSSLIKVVHPVSEITMNWHFLFVTKSTWAYMAALPEYVLTSYEQWVFSGLLEEYSTQERAFYICAIACTVVALLIVYLLIVVVILSLKRCKIDENHQIVSFYKSKFSTHNDFYFKKPNTEELSDLDLVEDDMFMDIGHLAFQVNVCTQLPSTKSAANTENKNDASPYCVSELPTSYFSSPTNFTPERNENDSPKTNENDFPDLKCIANTSIEQSSLAIYNEPVDDISNMKSQVSQEKCIYSTQTRNDSTVSNTSIDVIKVATVPKDTFRSPNPEQNTILTAETQNIKKCSRDQNKMFTSTEESNNQAIPEGNLKSKSTKLKSPQFPKAKPVIELLNSNIDTTNDLEFTNTLNESICSTTMNNSCFASSKEEQLKLPSLEKKNARLNTMPNSSNKPGKLDLFKETTKEECDTAPPSTSKQEEKRVETFSNDNPPPIKRISFLFHLNNALKKQVPKLASSKEDLARETTNPKPFCPPKPSSLNASNLRQEANTALKDSADVVSYRSKESPLTVSKERIEKLGENLTDADDDEDDDYIKMTAPKCKSLKYNSNKSESDYVSMTFPRTSKQSIKRRGQHGYAEAL